MNILHVVPTAPVREKLQRKLTISWALLTLVMVNVWYWTQNYPYKNITEVGLGAFLPWTRTGISAVSL